eukprot:m.99260 g.99260  ORF g.99260 m.99260 type:complete len:97 (-) comp15095_c0_seq4:354-644(-)
MTLTLDASLSSAAKPSRTKRRLTERFAFAFWRPNSPLTRYLLQVKLYATCDSEDGYINGNPAFTANVLDQVVDACGLKVGCRSLSVPRYAYNPLQP